MSPRKVKKFVENHKNDANDAAACAEAVTRENMRFVPVKTESQLEIQALHRVRSYYVKQQTSLMNMIRGLLLELGLVIPVSKKALLKKLQELTAAEANTLAEKNKTCFQRLADEIKHLAKEIEHYTQQLEALAKENEYCQRISTLPGIGPITSTAVVAKIGNGGEFHKGRELSAYLGLVSKQHSSGNTQRLGSISKHGDRYIRQLLIHGGRSSIQAARRKNKTTGLFEKQDLHSQWIRSLTERMSINKRKISDGI